LVRSPDDGIKVISADLSRASGAAMKPITIRSSVSRLERRTGRTQLCRVLDPLTATPPK